MLQNGLIIFDIRPEYDNYGRLYTVYGKLYDKRDDFDFPAVRFPYVVFQNSPGYCAFASQLIRYPQVFSKYEDFLFRGSIRVSQKRRTTFRKLYRSRHTDLFTNLTSFCHICWKGWFTEYATTGFQLFV